VQLVVVGRIPNVSLFLISWWLILIYYCHS